MTGGARTGASSGVAADEQPLVLAARAAAHLCGVSRSTWLRQLAMDRIPRPIRLGRRVFWRREELIEWIRAGCPQPRDRWEALRKVKGNR